MKRYEDHNYITLYVMFLVSGALLLTSVATLAFALWEDPALFQRNRWPEWAQVAGLGCLIGFWVFACSCWGLYNRPRLVVYENETVWVRNNSCGVAKFRWFEVRQWRVMVTPNTGEEGPSEVRTIEVELGSGRTVSIEDSYQHFVRAFYESIPEREAVEPVRCS